MNSRSLTLAIRLLTAACAGAALGTLTGCPLLFACPEPWSDVESVELGTSAEILALAPGGDYDELVAVGAGGVVVHYLGESEGASVSTPANVDLRGVVSNGPTIVVGDGGAILSSDDRGATWTARESGVVDNLLAVTYASFEAAGYLVAIAQEQVVVSSDGGQTWSVVTPPDTGWGGLRAVFFSGDQVWVVGAGGSAWASSDPAGVWLRQDLGTSDTLIGGGRVSGNEPTSYSSAIAVVTSSQVLYREPGETEWTTLGASFDGEIVAFGGGFVVTVNGTIYDITESAGVDRITNVGLAPRTITGSWSGFVVAGEGGNAARAYFQQCVGGRPWTIDGEVVTAKLVRSSAWIGEGRAEVDALAPELCELLAVAWGRDGQFEHASIASFARVIAELMQLGAPPELILASRRAIVDEIDHARCCFTLASRYAGNAVGPGPLPLPREPGRASVEAIAVAVFEEGCVNESVAAAEAAIAASEARDPQVRATLERIAADEREHASLAWKTLRWLLDSHGHEVAPALRRALVDLGAPLARPQAAASPEQRELDERLREHGRLAAHERAAIHRKVFAELIVPLSRELLGAAARAQA